MKIFIHPSVEVEQNVHIGENTKVWHYSHIRKDASVGDNCILGKNVFVDLGVTVGNNVKIQNNSSLYAGAEIEDGVFIGPHVILTNDKYPRAINSDGSLKLATDWEVGKIKICYGASIGAGAIILPGVTIGKFAMIGSGSVVTKDVADYDLIVGNPAKVIGKVDELGRRIK